MRAMRRWATVAAVAVALLAAVRRWRSRSPPRPPPPSTHWAARRRHRAASATTRARRPTPACTVLPRRLQELPGQTCWSCHAPGQDTSHALHARARPAARSATSGTRPEAVHDPVHPRRRTRTSGLDGPQCLDCHPTERQRHRPGLQPAPQRRRPPGLRQCGACHSYAEEARRQGRRAPRCHTDAPQAFHLLHRPTQPRASRSARSCHTMRHAGKKVAARASARTCHKGTGTGPQPAQHSTASPRSTCAAAATPRGCTPAPSAPASRAAARATAASSTPAQRTPGNDRVHELPRPRQPARQRVRVHAVPPRAVHNASPAVHRDPLRHEASGSRHAASRSRPSSSPCWWWSSASSLAATSTPRSAAPARATCLTWTSREVGPRRRQLRAVPHQAGPVLLPHLQARGPAAAARADHRRLREAHPRLRAQPVLPPLPHQRRRCSRPISQGRHPRPARAPHRGGLPLPALPLHHRARRRRCPRARAPTRSWSSA